MISLKLGSLRNQKDQNAGFLKSLKCAFNIYEKIYIKKAVQIVAIDYIFT